MSRGLTSGLSTAVTARVVKPILLLALSFDTGVVRMWSGIGSIVWAGDTYLGAGNFGRVQPFKEVVDGSAQGTAFTLNGIPSALLASALTENYQGRSAKLWLAALDSSNAIIADPYLIFGGRMDTMTISDDGSTGSITLTAENRLIDLNRSRERRYTDQDQKIEYPTDRGLEYVVSLQDKQVVWGSGTNTAAGAGEWTPTNPNPSDQYG